MYNQENIFRKLKNLHVYINAHYNSRSAWGRGVYIYACELLGELRETLQHSPEAFDNETLLHKTLLNGAEDWQEYSWGGCSLIYSTNIAERLCSPSELKRTCNGWRKPNAREEWLDTQARALHQAEMLIMEAFKA